MTQIAGYFTVAVIVVFGIGLLVIAIVGIKQHWDFINELMKIFLEKLVDKSKDGTLYRILLVFILVAIAYLVQNAMYFYGEKKASYRFTRGLKYSAALPDTVRALTFDSTEFTDYRSMITRKQFNFKDEEISHLVVLLPKTVNCKLSRIYEQLTDTILKAYHHMGIAREFMIQSFVCVSTASIFFIIAAACIAYIAKSGVATANQYTVVLLVASAAIGTFFIGLTKIFKQDENAFNNFVLYVEHVNLEQSIRSQLVLHPCYFTSIKKECSERKDTTFNKIISYTDAEMRKLNIIKLGFDLESVNYLRSLQTKLPKDTEP